MSERERELLGLVAQGFSNREIGGLLFIAERTVRTHCSNIIAKLEARNRTDAARIARETGLLDGEAVLVPEPLPCSVLFLRFEAAQHQKAQASKPRYAHRDGEAEPPTEPGYFWTECVGTTATPGARSLVELAVAPWGEWRQRWPGKGWEPYRPEKYRELGVRFWGPLLHPSELE